MLFVNYVANIRYFFELTKQKSNYFQFIITFFLFLDKLGVG